ncbi:MAG: hypothetical protein QNJ46_15170 [Leptolyngbyaceae cyanobacterium MO_188.B28]|nr:hypothetical protein [Leptolyngbyaceae cyanobacterium MO_188.B28]
MAAEVERASEMVAESALEEIAAYYRKKPAQEQPQYTSTETYSKQVLGQSSFELCGLSVTGTKGNPPPPWKVAPYQSPYIIDTNEEMWVGLHMYFDQSPLTKLLMCLGTPIHVCFSFEGFGKKTAEVDLPVKIITEENRFNYWIGTKIQPQELDLTPGFYQVAATVEVGPLTHKCGKYVFGYGYIGEVRVQIADQPDYPLPKH